jgi:hypothetical protein
VTGILIQGRICFSTILGRSNDCVDQLAITGVRHPRVCLYCNICDATNQASTSLSFCCLLLIVGFLSVLIIDAYPVPSYISSSPPSPHPPIRHLRTTAASKSVCTLSAQILKASCSPNMPKARPLDVEPYQPPNLIQSPAAAFLSILESSAHSTPATLFLLPSAHIPPPAPCGLETRSGPDIQEEWEPSTLGQLHKILSAEIGTNSPWSTKHIAERSVGRRASRRGDIGEGGMYI